MGAVDGAFCGGVDEVGGQFRGHGLEPLGEFLDLLVQGVDAPLGGDGLLVELVDGQGAVGVCGADAFAVSVALGGEGRQLCLELVRCGLSTLRVLASIVKW